MNKNTSAKWRRNRRHLRWLDSKGLKAIAEKNSKALRVQKFKAPLSVYPRRYRLPKHLGKKSFRDPKPLIDIFQEQTWVTIVAEIAGFNKETLKIDVKDQKLTLSAKAKDRKYYKSLNLPKVVIPNIIHTTLKNGVLQIKLKKATSEEAPIKNR